MNPSDQSETEVRLLAALQDAKAEYDSTKRQFELAMNQSQQREPSNGISSIENLVQAHQEAMQKYRRALLDFNRFIFDRKLFLEGTMVPDGKSKKQRIEPRPEQ